MDINECLKDLEVLKDLYSMYKIHKKRKNRSRKYWVRPILLTREIDGFFVSSFERMLSIDEPELFRHTRMRKSTWDILLNLLNESLMKTSIREPISPQYRLALTLMFVQGVFKFCTFFDKNFLQLSSSRSCTNLPCIQFQIRTVDSAENYFRDMSTYMGCVVTILCLPS